VHGVLRPNTERERLNSSRKVCDRSATHPEGSVSEAKVYLEKVVNALDAVAQTKLVWTNGFANPGGPHRRLAGNKSPISIGEDEGVMFTKLIAALRPENCFIVGNAFGFSSALIAMVMEDHGGRSVITLDAQTEGYGERNAQVARALTERLSLKILKNKKGFSPQDVAGAVEDPSYDLIFLDGCHDHPQVTYDLIGALPYAHDKSVIVLHDFWLRGVWRCAETLEMAGYHCLLVPTSCEIVLCTRDKATFDKLRQVFPEGVMNVASRKRLPTYTLRYLMTTPERVLSASWEKLTARGPAAGKLSNG
jgi:predicted O-methyltransferase YrrM